MRDIVCYFVGGPLDLSKEIRPDKRYTLYALERMTFTLEQIDDRTGAIGPKPQEYEYIFLGRAIRPDEAGRDVYIYSYNGLRSHIL